MHTGAAGRHLSQRGRRLTAFIAFGLVIAACGGSDESGAVASPEPGEVGQATDSEDADPSTADADEDVTVTSDDGILVVSVPAGSGPSNVTIDQIDLSDVDVPLVGFELGPDGATFSEPVTLTFSLPAGFWDDLGDGVPLGVVFSDGDGVEPGTTSREGDTVTVTAEVTHFSSFYIFGADRRVELQPFDLIAPRGGSALSEVTIRGRAPIDIDPRSGVWTVPDGFTLGRARMFPSRGEAGLGDGAFGDLEERPAAVLSDTPVTCISPSDAGGPLRVELELASWSLQDDQALGWWQGRLGGARYAGDGESAIAAIGLAPLSSLYIGTTSNVILEGIVECGSTVPLDPVEPVEQDCLTNAGILAPDEFIDDCIVPTAVQPGVEPFSLIVDLPAGIDPQKVIVSLFGGEDPATAVLVRFPSDGPPFAFIGETFERLVFDVPPAASLATTEDGVEIVDLPLRIDRSSTVLTVQESDLLLTGVTVEIGNQNATTTLRFDAQEIWNQPR